MVVPRSRSSSPPMAIRMLRRKDRSSAGLDAAAKSDGVTIFHAGTAVKDGALVANGGRVLNVCARGETLRLARDRAYAAIAKIDWPGGFFRRDIGWRALG